MTSTLSEAFDQIVGDRKTVKDFSGEAVSKETLQRLLDWAILAPNHRMNEPWRFRVVRSEQIPLWIEHLKTHVPSQEFMLFQKALDRLAKAGAVIYVSCLRDSHTLIDEENFAAASAATEHLLLGAASLGLASFWSSGKAMLHPESRRFLKVSDNERFVAAVWLGFAAEVPPSRPERKKARECQIWVEP